MSGELLKPLRYLIGADSVSGLEDYITEVPYDQNTKPIIGISIGYCNLLDENNQYDSSIKEGTSEDYNEGYIDPKNPDFDKNIIEQLNRRKKANFSYVELDNPDSYSLIANVRAINLAKEFNLKVIAKNPGLLEEDQVEYLSNPNVYGCIVERGAGTPDDLDRVRAQSGKPDLPIWFVYFKYKPNTDVSNYRNMWVSYSPNREYNESVQIT